MTKQTTTGDLAAQESLKEIGRQIADAAINAGIASQINDFEKSGRLSRKVDSLLSELARRDALAQSRRDPDPVCALHPLTQGCVVCGKTDEDGFIYYVCEDHLVAPAQPAPDVEHETSAMESLPARLMGAQYLWFTKLDSGRWACIYAHPDDLAKRDGNYPEQEGGTPEEAASAMAYWLNTKYWCPDCKGSGIGLRLHAENWPCRSCNGSGLRALLTARPVPAKAGSHE